MQRRAFLRAAAGLTAAGLAHPAFAQTAYPEWRPAAGTRRNISQNFAADVNPCPGNACGYSGTGGQKNIFITWSGGAFATNFSALGALIAHGGGHKGYYGNEVYAFDLDTLMWERLNQPWEPEPGARGWIGENAPLGPHGIWEEGEYAPGIPASSHTYGNVVYLPAALAGNRRGCFLRLTGTSNGWYGGGFTGRTHAFDLDTRRWRRYSVNLTPKEDGGGDANAVCFDPRRKRFWAIGRYYSTITRYLDIPTRTWGSVRAPLTGHNTGYNQSGCYHPDLDMFIVIFHPLNETGPLRAKLWGMSCAEPERGWVRLAQDGPRPNGPAPGLEWCPPLKCMVAYEGRQASRILKLTPPDSSVFTLPWRWEEEEIGGDPPAGRNDGGPGHYSRFRWAPKAGCFIWADGVRQPVQAWRPRGT
jgi:hypothetical protein